MCHCPRVDDVTWTLSERNEILSTKIWDYLLPPLPESLSLPTAKFFADGQGISHRQRTSLPTVRARRRQRILCRVLGRRQRPALPTAWLSAKKDSRQSGPRPNGSRCRPLCREPRRQALGKGVTFADGPGCRQRPATWWPHSRPEPPDLPTATWSGRRQRFSTRAI